MSLIPGNQTVLGNLTVAGDVVSFGNQVPTDPFGSMLVNSKTNLIDLKSIYGKSILRDIYHTASGASINNGGIGGTVPTAEFSLITDSTPTSSAALISSERGAYVAGYGAEIGVAVRFETGPSGQLVGDQIARWGYFDTIAPAGSTHNNTINPDPDAAPKNGFYFEATASNAVSACVVRNGVVTLNAPQSTWNVDKLDGTGPSGLFLDLTKGTIFKIMFSWYGFGAIVFGIVMNNLETGSQFVQPVHRYVPNQQTSVISPFLNIRITLRNNGTPSSRTVYVAGRQYSLYGDYTPNRRINAFSYSTSGGTRGTIGGAYVPILAIRRKLSFLGNPVKIRGLEILAASTDCFVQIRTMVARSDNATTPTSLTNNGTNALTQTWIAPDDQDPQETAVECLAFNTTGTVGGGVLVWYGSISGGAKGTTTSVSGIDFNLSEDVPIVVCAKSGTGANNTAFSCLLRWQEDW